MLDDSHHDQPPAPWDIVVLTSGNTADAPTDVPFLVVDEPAPGILEINHLDAHPDHPDFAAAVTHHDIALITRIESGCLRSWSPTRLP